MVKSGFLVVALLVASLGPAHANVVIAVDKSHQRMSVSVDGALRYQWVVSTGRANFGTPNGTYRPVRMAVKWFSKEYYNSPMPHSIFFHNGYAIHGSYEISQLGGPASHGCVRLHPGNAATLFALVKAEGMGSTVIQVSGHNPAPSAVVETGTPSSGAEEASPAAPSYGAPSYTPPGYQWRPAPFSSPYRDPSNF